MSDTANDGRQSADYFLLGLVSNPFMFERGKRSSNIGLAVETAAHGNQLLRAVLDASDSERKRVVWVEEMDKAPSMYCTAAQTSAERTMINDESLGILPAYLQLFMLHVGRIRATLNVLCERVATRSFDRTLAAWIETFAQDPDIDLDEWEEVSDGAWEEFVSEFSSAPLETLEEHFGPCVLERVRIARPPADIREASLEEEPEETDVSLEEDALTADVPRSDAVQILDACGNPALSDDGEVIDGSSTSSDPVVDYIVAYTRKYLSPVIGRALVVYLERGFGQLSSELKITKAPRKTLKAIVRLVKLRFRTIVVVYDGFGTWPTVPDELRTKIVTALTELKLLLGDDAVLVFLSGTDQTPELEDQFVGSATRLAWDFQGARDLKENEDRVTRELIEHWIGMAMLSGSSTGSTVDSIDRIRDATEGSLEPFLLAAGEAIEHSVERGAEAVEDEDVAYALEQLAVEE